MAIDLRDTDAAGKTLERSIEDRSDDDWIHCWSDGLKFEATCGPMNLREAIEACCAFVKSA